jgi:hypothetical protein
MKYALGVGQAGSGEVEDGRVNSTLHAESAESARYMRWLKVR